MLDKMELTLLSLVVICFAIEYETAFRVSIIIVDIPSGIFLFLAGIILFLLLVAHYADRKSQWKNEHPT